MINHKSRPRRATTRRLLPRMAAMLTLAGVALGVVALNPSVAAAHDRGDHTDQTRLGGSERHATLAGLLGMEVDDLREALRSGQTAAELAEANGVELQTIIDALVADITDRVNTALADGTITSDKAGDILDNVTERVTQRLNGEHSHTDGHKSGRSHRGARGGHRGLR